MSKSKDQKTKKPRTWNEAIVEASNTYDGTNYIYDGADDTIMTESEMLKKFTAQEKYEMLKKVANNQEKKEFREIERKYKKKSSIEPRTESSKVKPDTTLPLEIPNFIKVKEAAPVDDTLNKILKDRNKPDPDYFKGLGTFLPKKI
jgi:hypothetical protein|tara:strand:+ start:2022 stop:2459 length:438 start_codon:yes stop_codon:yes gene_type:complete